MQRPGIDEHNAQPEDFLCDYCGNRWATDRPMVEGHRGSLICGRCLTLAYLEIIVRSAGQNPPPGETCTMCLQEKVEPHWRTPAREPGPIICRWCIEKSARMLEKDRDTEWSRPTA
jgi:hypothetical protein